MSIASAFQTTRSDDSACEEVIRACAQAPRDRKHGGQGGTWIVEPMIDAYLEWHRAGAVHSVETWIDGELAGGLYGIGMGRMFFGESMFARRSDASKIALAALVCFCRANGIVIHPARFPALLPEYFIRYLTDPDDLVVDPFGGSCVTGMTAERLKRRWRCIELNAEYIRGGKARFQADGDDDGDYGAPRPRAVTYSINPPCSLPVDEAATPLVADGGASRAGAS